ncbi:MAG TPA: helix-turn-helix domain-containing protein [Chloroflexota bacterium]|nr:helix-turn-helix domain-containing protein [Chloroflexota bacterium]
MALDDEYRALVADFPPRPIRTEEDLARTEDKISELLSMHELTAAQSELLDILSTLVEAWENDNVPVPEVNGLETLKALLEENGLRQRDIAPLFGSRSIISEVLAGKRALSKAQIAALARFFHVSPAVFFPVPKPERSKSARTERGAAPPPFAVAASAGTADHR